MSKLLREIVEKGSIGGPHSSKKGKLDISDLNAAPGNNKFASKHETEKWEDREGNGEDVFKGKTKEAKYKKQKDSVYEATEEDDEKPKKGEKKDDDEEDEDELDEAKSMMKCESCGNMSSSCGCGSSVPEAKPGKRGMIVDKKKSEALKKVYEGAKVERMKRHIEKNEKKLGHSAKESENIAWATLNKRGMLNNKNKKMKTEQAAPSDTPMKLTYPSDEVGQVGRV
jgi:Fe-S oxidoreductase